MSVPKKRTTHSRTAQRRAHDFLTRSFAVVCSSCGEPKLRHRICLACGSYRGKKIIAGARSEASA